jgi:CDP-diacylglycerol--glycerol-3-phosphate 3-phosphatidyltransferase
MNSVNVANGLTVVRILLIPVVVLALLSREPGAWAVAAAVFFLAASTDGLDGYLARARGSVTNFGKVMDPVADKLLIAAALVSLERLAAWVAVVVIARELAVSGLRIAAGRQGTIISASSLGKAKTMAQVLTVLALILAPDPEATWALVLVFGCVGITVISGIDYFLSYRRRVEGGRRPESGGAPVG